VSAGLISEVSAKAGVANEKIAARQAHDPPNRALVGAANSAARHDSALMVFPQPVMILLTARPASLPDATEVEGI
jgi:hypothetical protein